MARRSLSSLIGPVLRRAPAQATPSPFEPLRGPAVGPRTPEGLDFLVNQNPDQGELAFRALNIKGILPRHIDPRYNLSIQVEDWTRGEYWWLRRGQSGTIGDSVGAVAAQQAFVDIFAGLNRLLIVDGISISATTATSILVRIGMGSAVAAGANQQRLTRDDRATAAGSALALGITATVVSGTSAAPVTNGNEMLIAVPGNNTVFLPVQFFLSGRLNVHAVALTINAGMAAFFVVRERELLTTETA